MEKRHVDRRVAQMEAEGTKFRTGVNVGVDLTVDQLRADFDAVVLAGGATKWRALPVPGRELDGIHQAMEFLPWANPAQHGDMAADEVPITAAGQDGLIIGSGDPGPDCLGTTHPQVPRPVPPPQSVPPPPTQPQAPRY